MLSFKPLSVGAIIYKILLCNLYDIYTGYIDVSLDI